MSFLPDFADPRIWPIYLLSFAVFALSLVFGGKPERWGVVVLVSMLVAQNTIVAMVTRKDLFLSPDPASIVADLIGLCGFTAIMCNARRLWPLAAFALQLLAVLGHLLQGVSDMLAYSYVTFKSYPTMMIVIIVAGASMARQLRIKRNGEDPDWVPYREYAKFRKMARELQEL